MSDFKIIQGGMGVGVSNWRLARAVSREGQLGVVSGTGIGIVLTRRLQRGDPDGAMRRALDAFPHPEPAQRMIEQYFIEGGLSDGQPYALPPMPRLPFTHAFKEITALAAFAEVHAAKEGHDGPVGINLLEKIQVPTLPSLYGAMLADVDYVLMGAGVPDTIPGILDRFAKGHPARLGIDVENDASGEGAIAELDPTELLNSPATPLKRPKFLAIVSSETLATALARKSDGYVDGFVVEGHQAGGHNAPPRGRMQLDESGEPVYGDRDAANLEKIRKLGRPFWLTGGFADANRLSEALAAGAQGVQLGTAFAFCEESGIDEQYKRRVIEQATGGCARVHTDAAASPTSFPLKVLELNNTLSQRDCYARRERVCDLGHLRAVYRKDDGTLGYRCPAEPVDHYVDKGGTRDETTHRMCICNALLATIGLGQRRSRTIDEPALVTSGDDIVNLSRFLEPGQTRYTAADVVEQLLG